MPSCTLKLFPHRNLEIERPQEKMLLIAVVPPLVLVSIQCHPQENVKEVLLASKKYTANSPQAYNIIAYCTLCGKTKDTTSTVYASIIKSQAYYIRNTALHMVKNYSRVM